MYRIRRALLSKLIAQCRRFMMAVITKSHGVVSAFRGGASDGSSSLKFTGPSRKTRERAAPLPVWRAGRRGGLFGVFQRIGPIRLDPFGAPCGFCNTPLHVDPVPVNDDPELHSTHAPANFLPQDAEMSYFPASRSRDLVIGHRARLEQPQRTPPGFGDLSGHLMVTKGQIRILITWQLLGDPKPSHAAGS